MRVCSTELKLTRRAMLRDLYAHEADMYCKELDGMGLSAERIRQ